MLFSNCMKQLFHHIKLKADGMSMLWLQLVSTFPKIAKKAATATRFQCEM